MRVWSRTLESEIHRLIAPFLGMLARRPLVLTLALGLVLVTAAVIPLIDRAPFRATIRGTGAEFTLGEQGDLLDSPLLAESVTLQHMDSVDIPGSGGRGSDIDRVELDGPRSMSRMLTRPDRVRGVVHPAEPAANRDSRPPAPPLIGDTPARGLQFGELRVGAGSRVRISQALDEDATDIHLLVGTWEGVVWLDSVLVRAFDDTGAALMTPDPTKPLGGDALPGLGPSVAFFDTIAGDSPEEPSRIRLRQGVPWRMTRNVQAGEFAFWDEEQGGRSMIEEGTVWIAEPGGGRTDLRGGDRIEFGSDDGHVHELTVADEISLRISGTLKRATLERGELRRPYLVRWYHYERLRIGLAIVIGLATILCGYELLVPGGAFRNSDRPAGR